MQRHLDKYDRGIYLFPCIERGLSLWSTLGVSSVTHHMSKGIWIWTKVYEKRSIPVWSTLGVSSVTNLCIHLLIYFMTDDTPRVDHTGIDLFPWTRWCTYPLDYFGTGYTPRVDYEGPFSYLPVSFDMYFVTGNTPRVDHRGIPWAKLRKANPRHWYKSEFLKSQFATQSNTTVDTEMATNTQNPPNQKAHISRYLTEQIRIGILVWFEFVPGNLGFWIW